MSFRRRHRWTRRILLGLACGVLAAPAQAKALPPGPGHDDSAVAAVQSVSGQALPDFSGAAGDPYLTDIAPRPGEAGAGPDGTSLSTSGDSVGPVRPDDRANRFTVAPGEPVAATSGDGFAVDLESGVTIGLGALIVALALGFAVGYLRRPRIAL